MNILENAKEELQSLFPILEQEELSPSKPAEETSVEENAPERKPGVVTSVYGVHGSHLDVLCDSSQVLEIAEILNRNNFFLESISGADWPKDEQLEVIYDYTCFQAQASRVAVRTRIPRSNPILPSISNLISGADWHERETYDFYGVNFDGHPNLIRILLPEDADFFPLLKDYMP